MYEITILHLSDVHFKREKDKTFRGDVVKNKMIDAIARHMNKDHVEPDFVAITGDIAFSGQENEYDEAEAFFKTLKEVLQGKSVFLAVPGNHDVDRDKIRKSVSLHQAVQNQRTEAFLTSKEEIALFINPKFKAFKTFVKKLNPGLY